MVSQGVEVRALTPSLFPDEVIMCPTDYKSLSPELLAEFSAGAGHDLNNPLAAISGRVQMMLREESDPAKRADLAVILTQVKRAQDMITDLRLTSRPPVISSSSPPRRQPVSGAFFCRRKG